jgi:tetratricopeptide (TPR) repeat protein
MRVAKIAFNKRDIAVALKALNKVPDMLTADPEYLSLLGACYVEKRDYERALKDFEKAATLKPGDPSIQFNIAEVYFVTKRWDEAIKAFQLLKPKPGRDGDALQALVEFKLMLCEEGRGNAGGFERRAEKNLKDPDSLLGIHTRAAMEYRAGKTDDAKRTVASAAAIFTEPLDRAPWYDTLVEFGYDIR